MGRIILVLAFKYADPLRAANMKAHAACAVCTPPTLLVACSTHLNVLAPWIGAKQEPLSLPLASFLVRMAPTMLFALRLALFCTPAPPPPEAHRQRAAKGSGTAADKIKEERDRATEVALVELVNQIVDRCQQLVELAFDARGPSRLFNTADSYAWTATTTTTASSSSSSSSSEPDLDTPLGRRTAFVRALCRSRTLQFLNFMSYLTSRPTFSDPEVELFRANQGLPWRSISLDCAFHLDDALFIRLFSPTDDSAPFRNINALTLTHSDVTNEGLKHLPTRLSYLQFEGARTVENAVEAWHDLAERCIHLETLKTYDFVCSTAALLPLAQRHFQFAYLKVLKLNNSGIDSTSLPLLVEVCPVLEELDLSSCLRLGPATEPEARRLQALELDPLADLRGLRSLVIQGSAVADMSSLARLTKLHRLYLADLRLLDVSTLSTTIERMTRLESLDLNNIASVPPVWRESPANHKVWARRVDLDGAVHVEEMLSVPYETQCAQFQQLLATIATLPRLARLALHGPMEHEECFGGGAAGSDSDARFRSSSLPYGAAPPGSLEAFFAAAKCPLDSLTLMMHGIAAPVVNAITQSPVVARSLAEFHFYSESRSSSEAQQAADPSLRQTQFGPQIGLEELAALFRSCQKLRKFSVTNPDGNRSQWAPSSDAPTPRSMPFWMPGGTPQLLDMLCGSGGEHASPLRGNLESWSVSALQFNELELTRFLSLPHLRCLESFTGTFRDDDKAYVTLKSKLCFAEAVKWNYASDSIDVEFNHPGRDVAADDDDDK